MTDLRTAWTEVGSRLDALALKLQLHAREELSEHGADLEDVADRVRHGFDEILEAFGDVARDPALRDDVKAVATSFADALSATVAEARDRVKRAES
jgi:hypothetical protein